MKNLRLAFTRHMDGHIRPVRAYVRAGLADRRAAQAPPVRHGCQVLRHPALLEQIHFFGSGTVFRLAGVKPDSCDRGGCRLGVRDAFNDCRRSPACVADGIYAVHTGLHAGVHRRQALLTDRAARCFKQRGVHPLAHGGNHCVRRNQPDFARIHRRASAGLVRRAQFHYMADQLPVLQFFRRQKFHELYAVLQRHLQLFLVRWHIAPGPAVNQPDGRAARQPSGRPGYVHRRIAAAQDDNVLSGADRSRIRPELFQERQRVQAFAALQRIPAMFPGADGNDHISESFRFQFFDGPDFPAAHNLRTQGPADRNILFDRVRADPEAGNHMGDHAAGFVPAFKHGDRYTGPAQECCRRKSRGTRSDHRDLFAAFLFSCAQGRQNSLISAARRFQLGLPDMQGFLIIVAHALVPAVMGADGPGNKRKRIPFQDDAQRLFRLLLQHRLQVSRNILSDGAAVPARSRKAVEQRQRLPGLPVRQRFHRFPVQAGRADALIQCFHRLHVDAPEGFVSAVHQAFSDLDHPPVSTRLQDRGGHGDRPDPRAEQVGGIVDVRAARIGDAQASAESLADPRRQVDSQREERAAGHVHFPAGQFALRYVHRERIRQLHAELKTLFLCQGGQAFQHRHRVFPLQILPEVPVVKMNIVESQAVQPASGVFISQQRRVQLDIGIQVFFRDQVGGNPLDLIRRTAVKRGFRNGTGNAGRDCVHIGLIHIAEAAGIGPGPRDAFPEGLRVFRLDHAVDEGVDFFALDPGQVISDGHIEHKGVRIAQAVFLRQQPAGHPGFDIFRISLGHIQFRGPFAVIALIPRRDAGFVHAGCQFRAVHLLDCLQLKEAGAGRVGRDNVLRQLRVRSGRRAEGRLDLFIEDRQQLPVCMPDRIGHAEQAAALPVFFHCPVHQLPEGHGAHDIAHGILPFIQ